jgi:uncharacterized protein YndB with AHSA1/START domain
VVGRLLNAAREEVWQAWTNPILLAQWWGPKGFRNTFYEFDLRPGGAWRFTMHAPNGADFVHESVFVEVVRLERIVFRHIAPAHHFLAAAEFTEAGLATAIRFSMLFPAALVPTAEECERSKQYGMQCSEESFDRLEALLAVTV